MARFDAELYLRRQGEEMLIGGRGRGRHPWERPLTEPASALVAVGAISAAKAEAVIDDYAFAEALRIEDGLRFRGSFGAASPRPTHKVKPLEPRRVVSSDAAIEQAQGTLHVRHVVLAENFTTLAVTWRAAATQRGSRRHGAMSTYGGGPGQLQPTVVDDRGTCAGTAFGGGGSDEVWEGHLTTDRPLGCDTAWIEIDGARVDLSAEPIQCTVSIEERSDLPAAHTYLWSRLAARNHFHELESLEPAIDALLAAGSLEPDDPVIDQARAVLEAMPHHRGMPSAGRPGRQVPEPWRSVLTRQGRQDGPEGTIALGALTPVFDGFSVAINSVESRPDGFQVEVDIARGPGGPFTQQLAWWAADDRGNHHFGQIAGWSGERETTAEIGFWPALHPKATNLRIMPTGESRRAVISVPLPWAEQQSASGKTSS